MSNGVFEWLKQRKALASAVAIAVIAGVPVTFAALHKGFPVSAVKLNAMDVWVTNGEKLLGGRLNHQIDQLDASVSGSSDKLDVLQDGSAYFLTDTEHGSVQRVDPAYVSLTDQITIPVGSWVGYGGDTLAILAPDGRLWALDASDRVQFDATKTKVVAKLGEGAVATVSKTGAVFAASPSKNELVSLPRLDGKATTARFAVTDDAQISAVGDTAVVLDKGGQRLRTPTATLKSPQGALRLQQPSAKSDVVLIATASALSRVPLGGGKASNMPAGGAEPASVGADEIPAPVQLDGCDYAAWAANARYLSACQGEKPVSVDIPEQKSTAQLEFRVNHGVIALNDVRNGDAWVASKALTLVNDWAALTPQKQNQKKSDKGQVQEVHLSYQDMAANRKKDNTRPDAKDDLFGVRPGRATVLPVLDNDQDVDGDVLTIEDTSSLKIDRSIGTLDLIDGGRALQYTPAPGNTSGFGFNYTVDDGRGGTDQAAVQVQVHQPSTEGAPSPYRESQTQVEAGQTTTYNVLQDWIDPDGDGIYLSAIAPTTADDVSFTPDGDITFTAKSTELGSRSVAFTVSDGMKTASGKLTIEVKAKGSLPQIAVPDFATVTLGRPTVLDPLKNDESPSGDSLYLAGADADGQPLTLKVDQQAGTIRISASQSGTYYFTYQLGSGDRKTVPGVVRVNVAAPEKTDSTPLAVGDVAYVHPQQSTEVAPLDNDISPSGRVLAVQTVTGGADAAALNVQLLDNTIVKITSPGVLPKQVQLTYTLTDGVESSQGTITVVPVAPLVNYQPPVAVTDSVNVRAGDIATVDVLDNDYSPDDQPFTLSPTLVSTKRAGAGSAFVSGSTVRYLAPKTAGSYSVTYRIEDEHQHSDQADVIFNVLPASKTDQAPEPQTLTARAFAGSAIPITVPLNGIDPDGDSVFFDGISDDPQDGRVTSQTATGFVYQAADTAAGTDEFHYTVEDALGTRATGLVRIAVIPRPSLLQQPTAVIDKVDVKPGKTASVQVLANDSDPNGYPLSLQPKLTQTGHAFSSLTTDGSSVIFTAPKKVGAYQFHYTVSNGHGGQAGAYVQVTVRTDAEPRYPTATDHYIAPEQLKDTSRVAVDALEGATNPSGPVDDLRVALPGVSSSVATVSGSTVTVRPQSSRTVLQYEVTDPATNLTGKAFIIVPPNDVKVQKQQQGAQAANQRTNRPTPAASGKAKGNGTQPPRLKVGTQIVPMNGTKNFSLGQLLTVPSKRPVKLSGKPTATGGTVTSSGDSFTFHAAKDYRGPASVRFSVDDGKDPGQESDRLTTLTLAITVGNADQSDVPPTFTPPHVTLEAGESTTVDLRAASYHPNQKILDSLTYTDLQQSTVNGVTAALSGSTLKLSTPVTTKTGTSAQFHFTVNSSTAHVPGEVDVVIQITKPLAQQLNPPQKLSLSQGTSATESGAVGTSYWVNPYPDKPLTITTASVVSSPAGVTVTHTANSITVTASSGATIGVANITYQVEDASHDASRVVIGQLEATIHGKPGAPPAPSNVSCAAASATFTFKAPAQDGGSQITGYAIQDNHGDTWSASSPTTRTVNGLANGTSYKFQVKATNKLDGAGPWSPWSASCTPYGKPSKPTNLGLSASNGGEVPATITATWSLPNTTGGGSVKYKWQLVNPNGKVVDSGTTAAGTRSVITKQVSLAGTFTFNVWSINVGSGEQSANPASKSITLTKPPAKSVVLSDGAATGGDKHYFHIKVTAFKSNKSYTVRFFCPNDMGYSDTIKTDGSGNWEGSSQNFPDYPYCGFDGHVTVGGVSSNTINMG